MEEDWGEEDYSYQTFGENFSEQDFDKDDGESDIDSRIGYVPTNDVKRDTYDFRYKKQEWLINRTKRHQYLSEREKEEKWEKIPEKEIREILSEINIPYEAIAPRILKELSELSKKENKPLKGANHKLSIGALLEIFFIKRFKNKMESLKLDMSSKPEIKKINEIYKNSKSPDELSDSDIELINSFRKKLLSDYKKLEEIQDYTIPKKLLDKKFSSRIVKLIKKGKVENPFPITYLDYFKGHKRNFLTLDPSYARILYQKEKFAKYFLGEQFSNQKLLEKTYDIITYVPQYAFAILAIYSHYYKNSLPEKRVGFMSATFYIFVNYLYKKEFLKIDKGIEKIRKFKDNKGKELSKKKFSENLKILKEVIVLDPEIILEIQKTFCHRMI